MQGTNGQNGQGGMGQSNSGQNKPSGLSWSQPASSASAPASSAATGKPSQPMTVKPVAPAASSAKPMNASATNNNRAAAREGASGGRLAGIFIAGVVVGFLIGWGWFALRPASNTPAGTGMNATSSATTTGTNTTNTTKTPATTGTTPAVTGTTVVPTGSNGTLSVDSQAAGVSVSVSGVNVPNPTWVVIYDNANGKPGRALGAAMFFPGTSSGTVSLLRATTPGNTYFAGENTDDGDHVLSFTNDKQVLGSNDQPLMVQFSTR